MSQKILITGGSGLLGKPLTRMLLQKGYTIHHLSRNPQFHGNPRLTVFKWDIENRQIDENCIAGVSAIIHLAGENIADKRWTAKRKEKIIQSRTESIRLLYKLLERSPDHQVTTVISASAIGYYGNRDNEILNEDAPPGRGFLPLACIEWEKAVDEGIPLNLRVVKLRTGIVLTDEGGALPEIAGPIKKGLGSPLGSGKQWMSWIHIQDVIRMYAFALENINLQGAYNMTAPNPVINSEMTKNLAQVLDRKLWLPNVPVIGLKVILGELSALVLDSARVSSAKMEAEGFKFDFPELNAALKEIYSE
jgi:uncharacterized protein